MKIDFSKLLESEASGVYRFHALLPDAALDAASRKKWRVVRIDLAAVREKNAFLTAFAIALGFPEHFGRNWDAFYDCLLDLNPGQEAGILLVLRSASGFARSEPDEFAAATGALIDATDYLGGEKKALIVIVELDTPALAPGLVQISRPKV